MNGRWIKVTPAENIPPREGRPVNVGGVEIAIFNINGRFLTIENACPHRGGPLCDGIITGTAVVCPLHGRHFDLETGMPVRASEPTCLTVFPTRVENGIVMVNIEAGRKAMDSAAA